MKTKMAKIVSHILWNQLRIQNPMQFIILYMDRYGLWAITILCMYVLLAPTSIWNLLSASDMVRISTMNVVSPPSLHTSKKRSKYSIEIHARSKRKESFIQRMELPHIQTKKKIIKKIRISKTRKSINIKHVSMRNEKKEWKNIENETNFTKWQ